MFRELQASRWKLLKTWFEGINRKLSTTHGSKSFLSTFEAIAEYRLLIIKILDLTLEVLSKRDEVPEADPKKPLKIVVVPLSNIT
jgi:hypothetical protein